MCTYNVCMCGIHAMYVYHMQQNFGSKKFGKLQAICQSFLQKFYYLFESFRVLSSFHHVV